MIRPAQHAITVCFTPESFEQLMALKKLYQKQNPHHKVSTAEVIRRAIDAHSEDLIDLNEEEGTPNEVAA